MDQLASRVIAYDFKDSSTSVEQVFKPQSKVIFIEPRPIRHQERVEDLFQVLFKRG